MKQLTTVMPMIKLDKITRTSLIGDVHSWKGIFNMNNEELNNPGVDVPQELNGHVTVTTLDKIYNWARKNSVWPMMFGLACCAIEMIMLAASRFDFSRFGMEVMRASPRQADLMIVSGTVTKKMIPQIVRLYNQMSEPKYVLAMGACACGGGPFKEGYSVISGVDKFIPVDVYVPGCPPTPQALLNGIFEIHEVINKQSIKNVSWYSKEPAQDIPIPILGPDLIDMRKVQDIKMITNKPAENATEASDEI